MSSHLLLRKRDDPEQRRVPSAMIAILSPSRSASSLTKWTVTCALISPMTARTVEVSSHEVCGE